MGKYRQKEKYKHHHFQKENSATLSEGKGHLQKKKGKKGVSL